MAEVNGTEFNDFIHMAGDGNVPPGGIVNEIAETTSGTDTITASQGSDTVFGADGYDTMAYTSDWTNFFVVVESDGTAHVTKKGANGTILGVDELHGIERITFGDGSYIDISKPGIPEVVLTGSDDDIAVLPNGTNTVEVASRRFGELHTILRYFGPEQVQIYTGEGNDRVAFSGDFAAVMAGEWSTDGNYAPFLVNLGGGDDTLDTTGATLPYILRSGFFTEQYGLVVSTGAGDDLVELGDRIPAYVGESNVGGSDPGEDTIVGGGSSGNWVDYVYQFTLSSGMPGIVADLDAGTVTNAAVPIATTLAGVQNIRGTNADDTLTGNGMANIFIALTGEDTINGADQEPARYDLVQGTAFSAITIDLDAGTATGFDMDHTLVDIEGAIGALFADSLNGDENDNWFAGLGGSDTANGGLGFDLWAVQYDSDDGTLQDIGGGVYTLTDDRTGLTFPYVNNGTDTISAFEGIVYTDLVMPVDPDADFDLEINIRDVMSGILPLGFAGGNGEDDTLTIYDGDPDSVYAITPEAGAVGAMVTNGQGVWELEFTFDDLVFKGAGKAVVSGDYDGTALNETTIVIEGLTTANSFDASGIVSGHRVILRELGGDDTLAGGAGNDDLQGGAGNGDVASFAAATSAIVHALAANGAGSVTAAGMGTDSYSGIEGLGGGGGNDRLTGNAVANFLGGHTGNDRLTGLDGNDTMDGGAGVDEMTGGLGNDTYYVSTARDKTIEQDGQGTDTVYSSVSRTLGIHLETLRLLGTANLTGNGNGLANRIYGNDGANLLQGYDANDTIEGGLGNDDLKGGAGADSMAGGLGNDIYYVDSANDRTVEAAAGGTDTVYSTVNITLAADLENLRLQGAAGLSGTGNGEANRITGNSGANLLRGLAGADRLDGREGTDTLAGGEGNDTLIGGTQADVFRFAAANAGADRIEDFNRNADRFQLSGGSFTNAQVSGADTILTHNGGTIRIAGVNTLTLAQWNALVIPGGEGGSGNPLALTADWPPHAPSFTLALTARLQNDIIHLLQGEWFFA